MSLTRVVILLPCHSLDDFPVHETGERAASLLANWTAAWHPGLIGRAELAPTWYRVDQPPEELAGHLVLIPNGTADQLPTGFNQRAAEQGGWVVKELVDRNAIVNAIFDTLSPAKPDIVKSCQSIDPDIVNEFYALSFAFLQIQVLTRHLRYSTSLDESYFDQKLLEAAQAATQSNAEACYAGLVACHDLLAEERNRYFPVQPMLIDFLLGSESTLGPGFEKQINRTHPVHLLVTGDLLESLAKNNPQQLDTVRQAVEKETIIPVGGSQFELPSCMLSPESLYFDLAQGRRSFQQHLNKQPNFYARRASGLTPLFPLLLDGFGYVGTTHFSLDSGRIPASASPRMMWEGTDEMFMSADSTQPMDATDPGAFLRLGVRLGEAIDSAHWASATFAHWSDRSCFCFDDLSLLDKYPATMGSFVSWQQWVEQSGEPGYPDTFSADDYFDPILKRSMIQRHENPISRWIDYWDWLLAKRVSTVLAAIENMITQTSPKHDENQHADQMNDWHRRLLQTEWIKSESKGEQSDAEKKGADNVKPNAAAGLAKVLQNQQGEENGRVVLNPSTSSRRYLLHTPADQPSFVQSKNIYVSDSDANGNWTVVDVPAGGFVSLKYDEQRSAHPSSPKIVDEMMLRNEFFEAQIDEHSGGLRSIHLYDHRDNLLSQKLSLRVPSGRRSRHSEFEAGEYCRMVCDSVSTTIDNRAVGEITTSGRIVDGEETVAEFQQSFRVVRGDRVIHTTVELDTKRATKNQPWESYYCSRLAWHDESATLKRSFNESRHDAQSQKLVAPNYIDIETPQFRMSLLTGGIPFHQRVGQRMLDSLLVVTGENRRTFEFGLGVNLPDPQSIANTFKLPTVDIGCHVQKPAQAWLVKCEPRNLVVTNMAIDRHDPKRLTMRLVETQCKSGTAKIALARDIVSARRLNFGGLELHDVKVEGSVAQFEYQAQDYIQIELQLS